MVYAYLRISTDKQYIRNQKEEILNYTAQNSLFVDKWITEIISGKISKESRKLGRLLRRVKKGDTIIVTEISRLSRTLVEVMEIMSHCLKKGIRLYSIKEGYAFDDSINSQVLCFAFGLTADIERRMISMRTKEALAVRKASGVILGRKQGFCPKLSILISQKNKIIDYFNADRSMEYVCRACGVSRTTMSRFLRGNADAAAAFNLSKERRYQHDDKTLSPKDGNTSDVV